MEPDSHDEKIALRPPASPTDVRVRFVFPADVGS